MGEGPYDSMEVKDFNTTFLGVQKRVSEEHDSYGEGWVC